jgi:hypothetical protein
MKQPWKRTMDQDIEPAVVVAIEKASPKAQDVVGGARNSGLVADFVEEALPSFCQRWSEDC